MSFIISSLQNNIISSRYRKKNFLLLIAVAFNFLHLGNGSACYIDNLIEEQGPIHSFTDAMAMFEYAESMMINARNKQCEEVLSLSQKTFEVNFSPITVMCLENFNFAKNHSQAVVFFEIAKTAEEKLEFYTSATCYQKAIEAVNLYQKECAQLKSDIPQYQIQMCLHQQMLLCELAKSQAGIYLASYKSDSPIDIKLKNTAEILATYNNVISCGKKAISIYEENKNRSLEKGMFNIQAINTMTQHSHAMVVEFYCAKSKLCQTAAEKRAAITLAIQAKQLLADKTIKQNSQKHIDLAMENLRVHQNCQSTRIPQGIKDKQQQSLDKKIYETFHNNSERQHIINYVSSELSNIMATYSNRKDDSKEFFESIRQRFIEMENKILEECSRERNLANEKFIYNSFFHKLDNILLITNLSYYMQAFAEAGDIDGAIHRLIIIKELQEEHFGKEQIINRVIRASLCNLQGDNKEWLALEAENDVLVENKAKKKASINNNKINARKNAIKEKQQHINNSNTTRNTVAPSSKPQRTMKSTAIDNNIISTITSNEEKEQKLKRHQEAQLKREEEKQDTTNQIEIKSPVVTSSEKDNQVQTEQEKIQQTLSSSDTSLKDIYRLTGTASRIDQSIEEGTWRFTREELQRYLEDMGCIYIPGPTNHKRLNLPSCMHVKKGDELITIFNEFGGSSILPKWEKDYVPHYLKGQILIIRNKLRALAIKAQQK